MAVFGNGQEQENRHNIVTHKQASFSPNPSEVQHYQQEWVSRAFTIQDTYVPLQAQPLNRNGEPDASQELVDLATWVNQHLDNPRASDQVLLIQAGAGRGKSLFCQIFADRVEQETQASWTPVLIRLRDIRTLKSTLEETLCSTIQLGLSQFLENGLRNPKIHFLFLLDGVDELWINGQSRGGLEDFLSQLSQAQTRFSSSELGHRIILTGRSSALVGMEQTLSTNFKRVEILPLRQPEQKQWLVRWEQVVGTEKALQFSNFLSDPQSAACISGSANQIGLAQEPLLLYLLAAMYQDEGFDKEALAQIKQSNITEATVWIYEQALKWLLTQLQPDSLDPDVTPLKSGKLARILTEAALCMIQSGMERTSVAMLESRLKEEPVRELLTAAQAQLTAHPFRNTLATFDLNSGQADADAINFVHKSLREFLCAERIKQSLEDWTIPGRRHPFEIPDEQLFGEIYDLFGAAVLTPEIVNYLMVLLSKSEEFQSEVLFKRLNKFYLRWSNHEFLDRSPTLDNYPQKAWLKLSELKTPSSLLTVDVYTGLNVLILLLKLHAQVCEKSNPKSSACISFHPCGTPKTASWDANRLLRIIHYVDALDLGLFTRFVGFHLMGANLTSANLTSANLTRANLTRANLTSALLTSTHLTGANLTGAYLTNAILISADLMGANLTSAYLTSANLASANLNAANLTRTYLTSANLTSTNLSSALLIGATLTGANLYSANLYRANLTNANLYRADFSRADLTSANFDDANLNSANLTGANLSRASLYSADLSNADLSRANLSSINLSTANLYSANLYSANLYSANLYNSNLNGANLNGANLNGANLSGITFNEYTNWDNLRGLDTTRNMPDELKQKYRNLAKVA